MKLESKDWEQVRLYDICNISSGKDIYETERIDGDIPYITSTSSNNGVKYFVSNLNNTIERNIISVNRNGSVGYSFYHKYEALYSNDCRKLKLKKYDNEYIALFVANQIMQQKEKYNYGYKMGTGRLKKQFIMIPVDKNKKIDYKFMEDYIKSLMNEKISIYIKYAKKAKIKLVYKKIKSLDEKQWKEFFIIDLFPSIQRGKRLTKSKQIQGNIPYVSSTSLNNGVDNYICNNKNVRKFANCLTIANSGSVGASFYQPFEFIASDHVTHLKNENMNEYVYLFISTMLNRLAEKYNFNREINDKRIFREKIILPVDNKGNLDYEYMEQYIKNVMFIKYNLYLNKNKELNN